VPNGLRVPWIGLEVERKTDLVALTAFFLALAGILYQFLGFLHGAKVELFRPEQVLIVAHSYGGKSAHMRIGARMAYANTGQPDYNATVERESVRFSLGGVTYEQAWQSFQGFDYEGTGQRLVPRYSGDASPVPVMAGSAISHETYFAPRPIRCGPGVPGRCDVYRNYLEWDRFIVLIAHERRLELELVADLYGDRHPKRVRCTIDLDDDLISQLVRHRWASPPCWKP
jgi:hypothetical protein